MVGASPRTLRYEVEIEEQVRANQSAGTKARLLEAKVFGAFLKLPVALRKVILVFVRADEVAEGAVAKCCPAVVWK